MIILLFSKNNITRENSSFWMSTSKNKKIFSLFF